jgi:hypothetical protein
MLSLSLALAVALSTASNASEKKTQLKIEVKPTSAVVYVDGKRQGSGAKPIVLTVSPGKHTIRIVHNKDEHQEVIAVKKGETTKWAWAFEDDRKPTQPAQPDEESPSKESPTKEVPEPGKEK